MTTSITVDILESFLHCRYKSYLQLGGAQGAPQTTRGCYTEKSARVRLAATDKLLTRHGACEILRSPTVTPAVLKRGVPLILDATLEDEGHAIRVDALQRASGPSTLSFHYGPVLFHEAERPSHIQRSLLALCGLLLDTLQGRAPGYGI